MRAIKVNGDYESVLFLNKTLPVVNENLEFLALFLSETPIYSTVDYDPLYLNYVESVTGRKISLIRKGDYVNWWGPLKNIDKERWLNSKLTSAEYNQLNNLGNSLIIRDDTDAKVINFHKKTYLAKDPFGMSGKGIKKIKNKDELPSSYPYILEPFLQRTKDFSHYFFADGRIIAYENLVDDKFQYRGSIFKKISEPTLENLSFHNEVESSEWLKFISELNKIKAYFISHSIPEMPGFSLDSFVYRDGDVQKIQVMSEVNFRRTMGSCAFELASRFGHGKEWRMLLMGSSKKERSLSEYYKMLESLPEVIMLTPINLRFQVFLISADNNKEGKVVFEKLKALLPDSQFSVDI